MKINHWFEARQEDIEKAGRQNDQILIMLFRTYLTVPVSEFRHFVVRNKESWEKGGITDPVSPSTMVTDKAWNAIKKHKNHWEKDGSGYGTTFIWYLYNASKGTKSAIFNIIGKMNIFRSEHECHDITKINNWFESHQDEIEKAGGKTINF